MIEISQWKVDILRINQAHVIKNKSSTCYNMPTLSVCPSLSFPTGKTSTTKTESPLHHLTITSRSREWIKLESVY